MKQDKTIYFSVSAMRIIVLSFLTLGLYQIYWMYKNWKIIADEDKSKKISPFWRSWVFGFIYSFPLITKISTSLNYQDSRLTFAYWLSFVIWNFSSFITPVWPAFIIGWFLSTFVLAFIQILVNKNNHQINPQNHPANTFLLGEFALVVMFIIFFSIVTIFDVISNKQQEPQNNKEIALNAYQNLISYPLVCQKFGYEMKKYPQVFKKLYSKKMSKITLPKAWEELSKEDIKNSLQHTELEITLLQKSLNQQKAVTTELKLSDACFILDENSEMMLITNPKLKLAK